MRVRERESRVVLLEKMRSQAFSFMQMLPADDCSARREYISAGKRETGEREKRKPARRPLIKLILVGGALAHSALLAHDDLLSRRSKAINRMEKIIDLLCNLLCCWVAEAAVAAATLSQKEARGRYIGEFIQYLRANGRECVHLKIMRSLSHSPARTVTQKAGRRFACELLKTERASGCCMASFLFFIASLPRAVKFSLSANIHIYLLLVSKQLRHGIKQNSQHKCLLLNKSNPDHSINILF